MDGQGLTATLTPRWGAGDNPHSYRLKVATRNQTSRVPQEMPRQWRSSRRSLPSLRCVRPRRGSRSALAGVVESGHA